jgi:hypothetical protein
MKFANIVVVLHEKKQPYIFLSFLFVELIHENRDKMN